MADEPGAVTPSSPAAIPLFSSGGTQWFTRLRGLNHIDGWANVLTGLGLAARDKRLGAMFQRDFEIDRNTLENLYHGDDVVSRVCELPVKEALREWIEITADTDRKISKKLDKLNARAKFFEANVWARLYGASVIVMVVDDGETLDTPLDPSKVKDVIDLMVIDRWDLWITRFYDNPALPNFGQPMLYSIRTSAIIVPGQGLTDASYGAQIHESRVLRFEGTITGRRRRRDNQGWALSIMDRVLEVCRDFSAAFGGMANLLQDYSQAVFKIKGLANSLQSDKDNVVLKRLQLLDLARSIARAIPLDADGEDFKREATPVAGLPDLLDRMSQRLSFATDIPITLLLGTSAAGLNATGAGDQENWYNNVHNYQEMHLRHPLSRLIQIIAIAVGVKATKQDRRDASVLGAGAGMGARGVPDIEANQPLITSVQNAGNASQPTLGYEAPDSSDQDIEFNFRPLWQPTEKETAETRLTIAQVDKIYFDMGVLDAAEIGVSRFGGEKYSIETTLDMPAHSQSGADDDAEDDPNAPASEDDTNKPDPALVKSSGNSAAGSDVQATALNGAQVTALQGMLEAVRSGDLPEDAAVIAIMLAFPAFAEEKVKAMIAAIEVKEPAPAPVMIPGVHPATGAPTNVPPSPVHAAGPGAGPASGNPVAAPGPAKSNNANESDAKK